MPTAGVSLFQPYKTLKGLNTKAGGRGTNVTLELQRYKTVLPIINERETVQKSEQSNATFEGTMAPERNLGVLLRSHSCRHRRIRSGQHTNPRGPCYVTDRDTSLGRSGLC